MRLSETRLIHPPTPPTPTPPEQLLDPWSGGGVLETVSEERGVVAVIIPEGALDWLRCPAVLQASQDGRLPSLPLPASAPSSLHPLPPDFPLPLPYSLHSRLTVPLPLPASLPPFPPGLPSAPASPHPLPPDPSSALPPPIHSRLQGAHHLDLMFSHPLDPPSVKAARATEEQHISRWIEQARGRKQQEGKRLERPGALGQHGGVAAQ